MKYSQATRPNSGSAAHERMPIRRDENEANVGWSILAAAGFSRRSGREQRPGSRLKAAAVRIDRPTLGLLMLLASTLFAGETQFWSQNDYTDFEKGVVKNLSMRSDGVLSLAPQSRELFDASAAYLWALAQDS